MRNSRFDSRAVIQHFEARVSTNAATIQGLGVLVKAGSMSKQQQTYVGRAIWNGTKRGTDGSHACHISPGGIYVVHQSGDPHFRALVREGYTPNKHGYLALPMSTAPFSDQGRDLVTKLLTATNIHPWLVNMIDLAAEGTRGNQLPVTAGEKTRLEHAISTVKLATGRETHLGAITDLAIFKTKEICRNITKRLQDRDQYLSSYEKNARGQDRELIEVQRELINMKIAVNDNLDRVLDPGGLIREAKDLYRFEEATHDGENRKIEAAKESYRAEEAGSKQ